MGFAVERLGVRRPESAVQPNWTAQGKKTVLDTVQSDKVLLSVKVGNVARHTINFLKEFFRSGTPGMFPNFLKVATVVTIPYNLLQIVESIKDFVKSRLIERIDAGLNIVANVGAIGEAITTFVEGLGVIGAVAVNALSWLTPVMGVSLVFQTAGIGMTIKSMRETSRFNKIFQETAGLKKDVSDYTLDDFKNALNMIGEKRIEQDKFITKHFRTDENKFADRLLAIESEAERMIASNDAHEVLAGKRLLQTTMQNLSARMSNKISSDVLSLISGAISYLGVALLFTPVPGVGFGLLALSGAVSLTGYLVDRKDTQHFENALGYKRSN